MRESSKTNQFRNQEFFSRYLSGTVLDIGCGPDPVVPHARPFDLVHGDASRIEEFLADETFDTVYSSHCLEHMPNVTDALCNWWKLVKPGGHMILLVPHEDLYEQGFWPSLFNGDHKASFRVQGSTSWSPVSFSISSLVNELPGCRPVSIESHDYGFRHDWLPPIPRSARRLNHFQLFLCRIRNFVLNRFDCKEPNSKLANWANRHLAKLGVPLDQTRYYGAIAQIQCVLQKQLDWRG